MIRIAYRVLDPESQIFPLQKLILGVIRQWRN